MGGNVNKDVNQKFEKMSIKEGICYKGIAPNFGVFGGLKVKVGTIYSIMYEVDVGKSWYIKNFFRTEQFKIQSVYDGFLSCPHL